MKKFKEMTPAQRWEHLALLAWMPWYCLTEGARRLRRQPKRLVAALMAAALLLTMMPAVEFTVHAVTGNAIPGDFATTDGKWEDSETVNLISAPGMGSGTSFWKNTMVPAGWGSAGISGDDAKLEVYSGTNLDGEATFAIRPVDEGGINSDACLGGAGDEPLRAGGVSYTVKLDADAQTLANNGKLTTKALAEFYRERVYMWTFGITMEFFDANGGKLSAVGATTNSNITADASGVYREWHEASGGGAGYLSRSISGIQVPANTVYIRYWFANEGGGNARKAVRNMQAYLVNTTTHTHNSRTFTAWAATDSLPDTAGKYYLTADVTLEEAWTIPEGYTVLCLNGFDIIQTGAGKSVISVKNGNLTVYDCQDDGCLTHAEGVRGSGVYVNNGAFKMYGGSITGNTASYGGGICADSENAQIALGGTVRVTGNTAEHGGGGIFAPLMNNSKETSPVITLSGRAEISGNRSVEFAGGGIAFNGKSITVSGNVLITGNLRGEGAGTVNNLHLYDGSTVTVGAAGLGSGAHIGVTTALAPTADTPVAITDGADADYAAAFVSDLTMYVTENTGTGSSQTVVLKKLHLHDEAAYTELTQTGGQLAQGSYCLPQGGLTATGSFTVPEGASVTLCLNGQTLDLGQYSITNNGTLTVCDCTATPGRISARARTAAAIDNRGTLLLTGGTVENSESSSAYGIKNTGTTEIAGGAVHATNGHGIWNSGGTVMIAGGTVQADGTYIFSFGICNADGGTVIVTGGKVQALDYALYSSDGSTAYVSGGTLTSQNQYGLYNYEGNAYLSGTPAVSGGRGDVYNGSTSSLYAENGTGIAYAGGDIRITVDTDAEQENTVVVRNVTQDNREKFTVTNQGYVLQPTAGSNAGHLRLALPHDHEQTAYQVWTYTGGAVDSGLYYLAEDITADGYINIFDGMEVTLCLNGHTLDMNAYSLQVWAGGKLTVCDCHTAVAEQGKITSAIDGYYRGTLTNAGTVTLTGGCIEYSDGENSGNAVYGTSDGSTESKFVLDGGTVRSLYGTGINQGGSYDILVYIRSGTVEADCGIFNYCGQLHISGGTVTGTTVAVCVYGETWLSGQPVLTGGENDLEVSYRENLFACDGNAAYTGDALTLKFYDPQPGDIIVCDVTPENEYKFLLQDETYTLARGEDENANDLVIHDHTDTGLCSCGGLVINENNFPDASFRGYILTLDGAEDAFFNASELSGVQNIAIEGAGITSVKGIEYFPRLRWLRCRNNQIAVLDVSKNTLLFDLQCSNNLLTELDLSKNTDLGQLLCDKNQLTELDLSKNLGLYSLQCDNNLLTELDVSKNLELTTILCGGNQLTELDVSSNEKLNRLYCQDNQLTGLNVSENTELTVLYCSGNLLTELDVHQNTKLTGLGCAENQLTELDVSANTLLTVLNCGGNQLTELDVSGNTALTTLGCEDNQLAELDVRQNPQLTELLCQNNRLLALDLSANTLIADFNGSGQTRTVEIDRKTMTYTMPAGFVGTNAAVSTADCSFDGAVLSVKEGIDQILYTYATGLEGKSLSVTLTVSNPHTHSGQDDNDCSTEVKCSCEKILVPAKSHAFTNDCDTDCGNDGCEHIRVITHKPNEDDGDCTTEVTCSVCDAVTTPARAAHTPKADDGDCTTAITCSECDAITTPAKTAHVFTNDCDTDCNNDGCGHTRVITHKPNEDDGDCTTEVICSVCDAVTTPARAAHTLQHVPAREAAKDADGNIEYWQCQVCGKYFKDDKGRTEITKADTLVTYVPPQEPVVPPTEEPVTPPAEEPVTPPTEEPSEPVAPPTGDSLMLWTWTALLLASALSLSLLKKKVRV